MNHVRILPSDRDPACGPGPAGGRHGQTPVQSPPQADTRPTLMTGKTVPLRTTVPPLDIAPVVPAPMTTPTSNVDCPKCGTRLVDPAGMGLCPKCGFCRSLRETDDFLKTRAQPVSLPTIGLENFLGLVARIWHMPPWAATLLLGFTVIGVVSTAAGLFLGDEIHAQALWGTVQILAGGLGIVCAQVLAYVKLLRLKVWGPQPLRLLDPRTWFWSWGYLPRTEWAVWLGSWGVALIIGAVVGVGGQEYWFTGEMSLGPLSAAKSQGQPESTRTTRECVVIGFRPSLLGGVDSLLIGAKTDAGVVYLGMVHEGFVSSTAFRQRLELLKVAEPAVEGLRERATWVRPTIGCTISYAGYDALGRPRDIILKEVRDATARR